MGGGLMGTLCWPRFRLKGWQAVSRHAAGSTQGAFVVGGRRLGGGTGGSSGNSPAQWRMEDGG